MAPNGPAFAPPEARTDTAPEASTGGRAGAFIGLLGGAAGIVGAFLTWMTLTTDGHVFEFAGWQLSDDAKIVVGIGAVAVMAGFVGLIGVARAGMRTVLFATGLAMLGMGAYDTYDILNKLPGRLEDIAVSGAHLEAPGIGLILVFVGGGVMLIGALAMRPKRAVLVGGASAATANHPMAQPGPTL